MNSFKRFAPNQVWMTDITYVPTDEGWLYLASVMDLYSRKIVGFHMDERMKKSLVIKTLDQAYRLQQPRGEVLHHSNRGSQYAPLEYQERLKKYKMKGSMSRKEARERIFEYIACFYMENESILPSGILHPISTNVCTALLRNSLDSMCPIY
ncbi:DDE-type integrase/transposase/recombinase [Paenibacillus sp. A3]|uniref:DDE-type integrase/transposase/recombinase n=1 Tax=Paenibacillus sp. A3 TaxID=1337054 RepID=UPI0034DE96C0